MAEASKKVRGFINGVLQGIVASLVIAVCGTFWQKVKHGSVDWWAIGALFLLTCVVFSAVTWWFGKSHVEKVASRDESPAQILSEPLKPPSVPDLSPPHTEFEFSWRWAELVYQTIPGYWREANDFDYAKNPRKSLVVLVTRQPPPKGEPHKDVTLTAIIKFTRGSTLEHQVSNAYWLNSTYAEENFDGAHQGCLVIGSYENDQQFASYDNQYLRFHYEIIETTLRTLGPRKASSRRGTICFEIYLIDASRRVTIAQKKFEITFNIKAPPIISEE